jgi:hypothetical protein
MQKFWPAHDAVAKLRHEAAISETRASTTNILSEVQSLRDRLDRIERSTSAAANPSSAPVPLTPPLWVEHGATGLWIGPTASVRPSTDGSRSIQVPLLGPAASSQVDNSQSLPFVLARNRSQRIVRRADNVSRVQPSSPRIVLNPQAPPAKFQLCRGTNTVYQLWTEWVFGLDGIPSVEALDRCWGARWRPSSEAMFYSRRRKIISDIRRRVGDGTAKDDRQAIDQLEQLRAGRSLDWLCKI